MRQEILQHWRSLQEVATQLQVPVASVFWACTRLGIAMPRIGLTTVVNVADILPITHEILARRAAKRAKA